MEKSSFKFSNFKNYLDKFLVFNLFLIIAGSLLFLIGVFTSSSGNDAIYMIFQKLWFPLFIPALSTFFTAVLIEGLWNFIKKL